MYPLDQGLWGPTVRITHLRAEMARLVDLDVVSGWRGPRRVALARYALSGRLRGLDGVYVESSSFLPAETDVAFLALAKALGIPVVTYIRDAYQLFDEYYPIDSVKRRFGRATFRSVIRSLRAVSTHLGVQTTALGAAIGDPHAVLLPPGAPAPVSVTPSPGANRLLFVGDARLPAHGADRLLDATALARERGAQVELTVVARPGQEPPGPQPEWLRLERAEGPEIHALLPEVVASVIPRPRNRYNDLVLPIKLFDYLAYGRPLLVTDCDEQAAVVRSADAGLVASDDVASLADGIGRIVAASDVERAHWGRNAHAAAAAASWERRARSIVQLFARGSDGNAPR